MYNTYIYNYIDEKVYVCATDVVTTQSLAFILRINYRLEAMGPYHFVLYQNQDEQHENIINIL